MKWINAKEQLPDGFPENSNTTKPYLVFIDNPYFKNGNYHIARLERVPLRSIETRYLYTWRDIEPNVHHGNDEPNVTHWCELPEAPKQ